MSIYDTRQAPLKPPHYEVGGSTNNLTYVIHGPLYRRPDADTLVMTIVRPAEPPLMGLPSFTRPPVAPAIAEDLGPHRPPFGEHGTHRRPANQRLRAAIVAAVFVAIVVVTGMLG